MKRNMTKIGTNIRHYREMAGLRQADLASKIHVSQNAISSWEIGRTEPSMKQLQSLCDVLNVSVLDICGIDQPVYVHEDYALRGLDDETALIVERYKNADDQTKEMVKRILLYAEKMNHGCKEAR